MIILRKSLLIFCIVLLLIVPAVGATRGEQNALSSAKDFLRIAPFSYSGLIQQLEFEEYTHEEAVYAAKNCGADWNEQALRSARQFLDFTSFSLKGLIDQLMFEGFTREQAEYGAKTAYSE